MWGIDIRYILMGVCGFILFVALGSNPTEQPQQIVWRDLFKEELEEAADGPGTEANGAIFAGQEWDVTQGGQGSIFESGSFDSNSGFSAVNPGLGNFEYNAGTASGITGSGRTALPRLPGQATATQSPITNYQDPDGPPRYYLSTGQQIFFAGEQIFTLSANGQLEPLADGNYKLSSGQPLLIRDGKRYTMRK